MGNRVHHWTGLICIVLGSSLQGARTSAEVPKPQAVQADPGWYLRGGMLTGHFLGPKAQADWPLWMQALIGGRQGVSSTELRRADLAKIPDAFLAIGIQRLEERRIFEPRLLRQATAIGYTARATEWQEAKSVYQVAYVQALGLPRQDPLTTSRLMTQLAYRNEFDLLRQAMAAAKFPPRMLASLLRLVDLRSGLTPPSESWVLDPARPAVERLPVLRALRQPVDIGRLLATFQGTDQLDLAVWHALTRDWIALDNPWVTEALLLCKQPQEDTLWFLNRPEERVSDLLWLRATEALGRGDRSMAVAHAKTILARYPQSMYVGHASFLLAHLDPAFPPLPQPALRIPGDITLFNAEAIRLHLRISESPWPASVQALAAGNRFDLILAQADPETEEAVFLQAAARAGQQDLVARHQALGRRTTLETAPFLFPVYLKPLVERLIREEGLAGAVDPAFVLAMIKNESIFQPDARSGSEAFGIMQLLRPTFRQMAGKNADILNPETNIRAGLRYYRTVIRTAQLETLPEEVRMLYILAGYHAGEGRARRWRRASEPTLQGKAIPIQTLLRIQAIPISSTRFYIQRVLGDREVFKFLLRKAEPLTPSPS